MRKLIVSSLETCACILVLFIVLTSCASKKDRLSKLWFFTHWNGPAQDKDSLLNPASFLELRHDGSYTRDFGKFQYGKWDVNDHQLLLKDQNGQMERLVFVGQGSEIQLEMPDGAHAYFESQPLPAEDVSEDPFALENNRWRIPAAKPETDQQIKSRLLNHCRFWEAYFTWALKNKYTYIDVRSTPTPIKIYSNGFGLKPMDELAPQWVSYFYDSADCQKASEKIKYVFQHKNVAWAQTDNKFKMFISAFQQMQQFLR